MPREKKKTARWGARLPPELLDSMREAADSEFMPVAVWVERAIRKALKERQDAQHA